MVFNDKHRIVTDRYSGYEVQVKLWWWPFWLQYRGSNTHASLEKAKEYLAVRKVVWEEEEDSARH